MTLQEYFGDWLKVIDKEELNKILAWLKSMDSRLICPSMGNIFKAFELCPYKECHTVFIGQDPYPDKYLGKARATGILFGNNNNIPEDKLSPSLKIIKDSVINLEVPHNIITFDHSLESWAKQGILMINSALTCEMNKVGSHTNQWRAFMTKFIRNLSERTTGIVYVLFGNQAQSLEPCIGKNNFIIKCDHPAYYARLNKSMPHNVFEEIDKILKDYYNIKINWYGEET